MKTKIKKSKVKPKPYVHHPISIDTRNKTIQNAFGERIHKIESPSLNDNVVPLDTKNIIILKDQPEIEKLESVEFITKIAPLDYFKYILSVIKQFFVQFHQNTLIYKAKSKVVKKQFKTLPYPRISYNPYKKELNIFSLEK